MSVCPRCQTAWPEGRIGTCARCLLTADLEPALLGDSLELIEEIGRGGMGTVYKARHLRLGRLVAVKFLADRLAASPDAERRLEREARALARLDHPGIVRVHDFGQDQGRSYIVMEYVDGQPLSALLPLPPAEAVRIALDIGAALRAAHAEGIVHRDVKPDNVLIDAQGRVKVSDFGIARLLAEPGQWTVTGEGAAVGTPRYMAPEALAGALPDPRMDVYSLGVVLYEMLTGQPPVGDFPPVPGPLDRVVRRALAADPARRHPDVEALCRDLRGEGAPPAAALPPDERNWMRAVALLHTLATAAALWALVISVTPRVIAPGDVQPLVMLGTETLPAGGLGAEERSDAAPKGPAPDSLRGERPERRVVSRARFETGPILAALGAAVVALLGHGLLRRHWRHEGLDQPRPDVPVASSRLVFACGATALGLYLLRRSLGPSPLAHYVPLPGGLLEVATLYLVWASILEAWRTHRPLAREVLLWTGLALALVPPVNDLASYLARWRP